MLAVATISVRERMHYRPGVLVIFNIRTCTNTKISPCAPDAPPAVLLSEAEKSAPCRDVMRPRRRCLYGPLKQVYFA
eukprot:6188246-Pleurochrysis_carterae.AAC.1